MKDVPVSKEVWQMLRKIKDEKNLKHLNEVVKLLMEQYFIEQKTNENEEPDEVNAIEDQPLIYDIDDETVRQPVEKIDKVDDRFSIDRKTLGKQLQINKNTNLQPNKIDPYVNQHPTTRTGGRLRQRLYARKHQLFPDEKTVNTPPIRSTVIKCRWCSQTVNITEGDISRGYITCPFCNGEIRV